MKKVDRERGKVGEGRAGGAGWGRVRGRGDDQALAEWHAPWRGGDSMSAFAFSVVSRRSARFSANSCAIFEGLKCLRWFGMQTRGTFRTESDLIRK